jgi:hypothetical protein
VSVGDWLIGASSSISTLEMTDEDKTTAADRRARRGTFGFGRVLDRPAQDDAQRGRVDGDARQAKHGEDG